MATFVCLWMMVGTTYAQTLYNLATRAIAVSASVESEGHPVTLVKDSRTTASKYWSSYHGEVFFGQYEFVEFRWEQNNDFTEIRAYWVTPDENHLLPNDAYVAWWDGHEWQRGTTLAEADEKGYSQTKVEKSCNRLRVYMKSDRACGLCELKLFGYLGTGCVAAVLDDMTTRAFDEENPPVLAPQVKLPDGEREDPIWNWTLPDGSTAITATVVARMPGEYVAEYQRQCGTVSTITYKVFDPSVSYRWEDHPYNPTLNYDFRWEYPKLDPPSKGMLPENVGMTGHMEGEWWACGWGSSRSNNKYLTDIAIENLLKKMDTDFTYFRNEFGWPPDKRARNGYFSTVYIVGSGINGDHNYTQLGGWQSATNYKGSSWPMVYISYYPVACFDPSFTYDSYRKINVTDAVSQQNACVHEGIHATFADLDGCKESAWFHEGGNTWLQGEAELAKSGVAPTSMGWLSAGNMIAPFMPIECYSGWLQDDSFGGPSAEGVNMYNNGQQVCTWRKLLGGVQYGELFPHFLSEIMGRGAIPWIWRYCKTRVLEGMADSLGDVQMRHLILEYRARQAMIDVGQWSKACKKLMDDNWLVQVEQEHSPYWRKVKPWPMTPYVNMYKCDEVDSLGWWRPEWRTTPGWSGANQIPLHVSGKQDDLISVRFQPLGKNMVAMLCYRAKNGNVYYSEPIYGEGDVLMKLQEEPANKVVILVVCNTDYVYEGEGTRKAHFDYRLRMGENVFQPAKAQLKWYNYSASIKDQEFISGIEDAAEVKACAARFSLVPERTIVKRGEHLPIHMTAVSQWQIPVQMYSQSGQLVYQQGFLHDGILEVPSDIAPGFYVLRALNGKERASAKIVVK